MTDCPNGDVRDALPDYLHDRLDPVRRREAEAHLAGCDTCRQELALLRALRATTRRAPAVDAAAIAAAIPPYRVPARRGRATGWRAAAAVVAFAVGGTSIALLWERAPSAGEDVTPYVQAVPAPQRETATPNGGIAIDGGAGSVDRDAEASAHHHRRESRAGHGRAPRSAT